MVYEVDVIDEQIEVYAQLCASDPECSERTDDLAEVFRIARENMPERWLGIRIDPGHVRWGTFETLANTLGSQLMMTFDMWIAAANGDYSGMATFSLIGPIPFLGHRVGTEYCSCAESGRLRFLDLLLGENGSARFVYRLAEIDRRKSSRRVAGRGNIR